MTEAVVVTCHNRTRIGYGHGEYSESCVSCLLHERQTEARAVAFVGEERTEDPLAQILRNSRTVVLHLDRAAWEAPVVSAHSGVLGVLIEHADLLLTKLPRGPDLVERTRRAIGGRLRGGDPSLESVAHELGMSERSLQRHLRDLGYTFNALADEVRQATARLYLQQPDMALAEIAYLLGFAEQSTFNRAFKRWTGSTPKQARTRALHAGPEVTSA